MVFPFTQEAATAEKAKAWAQAEQGRAVVVSQASQNQQEDEESDSSPEITPTRQSVFASDIPVEVRMGERYGRPTRGGDETAAGGGALDGQTSASSSTTTIIRVDDVLSVKIVEPPKQAGRFVGLWALANHALEYPFIGPLFEEDLTGND